MKELNSFARVLNLHGFRKVSGVKGSYSHACGWYAEILDRGHWKEIWLTGAGLKECRGFPGGWVYGSPEELNEELKNSKP